MRAVGVVALALAQVLALSGGGFEAVSGQVPGAPGSVAPDPVPSGSGAPPTERVVAVVDFIAGADVFMSAGTDHGVAGGDTILVYRSEAEDAGPVGQIVVRSATARRSVARVVSEGLILERGEILRLGSPRIAEAAAVRDAPVAEPSTSPGLPSRPPSPDTAPAQAAPLPSATWRGSAGIDLDARQTDVSWTGNLAGKDTRRFATPALRLMLRGTDLPGGWEMELGLRGSYRYTDGPGIAPETSIRVYQMSLSRRLTALPGELLLGRFTNPFEPYSAYWDGALFRIGGERSGGIGVVAGLEPDRYDEAPSSSVRKLTAFADYSAGRGTLGYDTDLSFHLVRPEADSIGIDRTFAGWSQRLTAGRLSVDQRLQVDRDPDAGGWSLTRLRIRGTVRVGPTAVLHAGVLRSRPALLAGVGSTTSPLRDQLSAGASVRSGGIFGSLDLGITRRSGEEDGRTISGSLSHSGSRVTVMASGSRWSSGEWSTVSAAPMLTVRLGSASLRAGYRINRTDGFVVSTSHSADLDLTFPFGAGWRGSLGVRHQWGSNYGGSGISTSISRTFGR